MISQCISRDRDNNFASSRNVAMKVLVTGASGFLGQHLCAALRRLRGDRHVRAPPHLPKISRRWRRGRSICATRPRPRRWSVPSRLTPIVHLAALEPGRLRAQPEEAMATNCPTHYSRRCRRIASSSSSRPTRYTTACARRTSRAVRRSRSTRTAGRSSPSRPRCKRRCRDGGSRCAPRSSSGPKRPAAAKSSRSSNSAKSASRRARPPTFSPTKCAPSFGSATLSRSSSRCCAPASPRRRAAPTTWAAPRM